MPRPIAIVFSLLLVVSLLAALLLFNPALVVRPLLQAQLSNAGFQLLKLDSLKAGAGSASATALIAESPLLSLAAQDIQVSYSLGQLFNGQVAAISIAALDLQIKSDADGGGGGNSGEQDLLQTYSAISALPLDNFSIEAVRISSSLGEATGQLAFQTRPVQLSLTGQWQGAESLDFNMESEALSENRILLSATVSEGNTPLFTSEQQIELLETGLTSSGELALDPNKLRNAITPPGQESLSWALLNDSVSIEYQIALRTDTSDTRLESLLATLNVGDGSGAGTSSLQIQADTAGSSILTQLGLPLSVTVLPNSVNESFAVEISNSYHTASWNRGNDQVHVEANFSDVRANCETWNQCVGSANFQLLSPAWEIANVIGVDARAAGELEIELLPGLVELETNAASLTLDTATYDLWRGSAVFELEQLFLILGEVDRGRIRVRSNSLSARSPALELVEPQIAGTLNYFDDALAGSVDFTLGAGASLEQPMFAGSFNHSLSNSEGHAEFSINEMQFSEASPFSSLVQQQGLNMDVVAGTASGAGQIDWNLATEEQQVSGPLTLKLNGLSGHLEETLLLGLSTEARGEFQDWTDIVSAPGLTATIEVVDIGLPSRNVRWQYSFDTAEREMLISELNSEMFGGKIEIADFRIDPDNLNQDLTLVLSRLNLESIVELAGYPQLFVDGLISGYIPVTLRDGQILINDGLVGALKPGGNIRYTPSSSAAVNQTMELVNDALSNYQYETLDTRVYYDENGDLRMEVQLQGTNPDMNGGQPINLNVNVTDNIPSLLRSLKAGQEISERLEQHLQNR